MTNIDKRFSSLNKSSPRQHFCQDEQLIEIPVMTHDHILIKYKEYLPCIILSSKTMYVPTQLLLLLLSRNLLMEKNKTLLQLLENC